MATESIGTLIPTAIPGYADAADIQAALRAYHYGSYSYDPANTSPASLVSPSMAKTIYDIQQDIITLENRPSSGGEATTSQPQPSDFTPVGIPDGFIWVDSDGTIGGQPTSATAFFTNSAPTSSLTTGVIWVDKDPTVITANPFIPQAVIAAKGDLVVGTANDTAGVLSAPTTNGYMLYSNSATVSGLEWGTAPAGYSAPTIGSTTITSGATVTTIAGLTLTGATVTTPTLTLSSTTSTTSGRIAFDATNDKIIVGDGTNAVEFASSNLLFNAQIGTTYTFVLADKDKLVTASNGSAQTYSIPTNATAAFPIGTQINIIQIGTGQVTINAVTPGTTTISSTGATSTAPKLRAQFSSATLIKAGTDLWYVVGDID